MQLKLTNTLYGKVETFIPLDNKKIKMYVCGPTVYDNPHIGNARALVVYDILYRVLSAIYGRKNIIFVRNITDIDDKIIDRASTKGITFKNLANQIEQIFFADCEYLNCIEPTYQPRATETIDEIIDIIQRLIDNKNAYISQGHVYFDTSSYAEYGKLAGKELEKLRQGVRIETTSSKKSQADFVLWKPSNDEENSFESPFGRGRPGWHIECSAMSYKFLGSDFDIHGGGADLMFPHHTNEIAQSCCAFKGSGFARYWIHNGFLSVNGEKMSKSSGNFITVRDLHNSGVKGEALRMLLLSSHYRSPIDYNQKLLEDVKYNLDYLYRTLKNYQNKEILSFDKLPKEFQKAILDDLNVSKAFSIMLEIASKINKSSKNGYYNKDNKSPEEISEELVEKYTHQLYSCGKFLGIFEENYDQWFGTFDNNLNLEIQKLIEQRKKAKQTKDWAKADRIRDELSQKHIILEDNPDGTTSWRKK